MIVIQSDIKIAAALPQQAPATINKFARLPVVIQQRIATYLSVSDLRDVSLVNRLFKQNMACDRIWAIAAKNLSLEPNKSASKQLIRFYSKMNELLLYCLPEDYRKKLEDLENDNPIELYDIIVCFISNITWDYKSQKYIDFEDRVFTLLENAVIMCDYLDPGVGAFRAIIQTGFIQNINFSRLTLTSARIIRYFFTIPQHGTPLSSEYISLYKLIVSEFLKVFEKPNTANLKRDIFEHLSSQVEYWLSLTKFDVVGFLLSSDVRITEPALKFFIDEFYFNVFDDYHNESFPIIISHCNSADQKYMLARLKEWEAYPHLLNLALEFARGTSPNDAYGLSAALQKVQALDWIKQAVLKLADQGDKKEAVASISAASANQPVSILNAQMLNRLVRITFGNSNTSQGNPAAFKALLRRYLHVTPNTPILQSLLQDNSVVVAKKERVEFQTALLQCGAKVNVETLQTCIQWKDFVTPVFNAGWVTTVKSTPEAVKRAFLKLYQVEKSSIEKIDKEKIAIIGNVRWNEILQKYEAMIKAIENALKLSEADAKSDSDLKLVAEAQPAPMLLQRARMALDWITEQGLPFLDWWIGFHQHPVNLYIEFIHAKFNNLRCDFDIITILEKTKITASQLKPTLLRDAIKLIYDKMFIDALLKVGFKPTLGDMQQAYQFHFNGGDQRIIKDLFESCSSEIRKAFLSWKDKVENHQLQAFRNLNTILEPPSRCKKFCVIQ